MATNNDEKYVCIHEDRWTDHEAKLKALETRADYKDQRIDDLKIDVAKMDKKLDKITDSLNDLQLQSNRDDYNIDARVTAIESKIETLKWIVGAGGLVVTLLTFYMNFMR